LNAIETAHEILSGIPGWKTERVSVSVIDGGLTNRTLLVERDGERFVLRVEDTHTDAFPLDREREAVILRSAYQAGIAPEPVFADPDSGVLLCRYVAGRVLNEDDLRSVTTLHEIAELMRKVHALPPSGYVFDPSSVPGIYADTLRAHAERFSFLQRCLGIVAEIPAPTNPSCCHNDIVAANIIASPSLSLVDWEYACDNDPLFDLASLIGYHDLPDEASRVLLRAYAGDELKWDRLQRQLRLYDALQWLWFASRQVITFEPRIDARLAELEQRLMP
jgi:thiamine kinase